MFWRTVKSATNNVLLQNTITTEEWFGLFHQVFNGDMVNDIDVDAIDEPLINADNKSAALDEDIIQLEVQDAIKALKNYEAPGPDGLNGDFLKVFCSMCSEFSHEIF